MLHAAGYGSVSPRRLQARHTLVGQQLSGLSWSHTGHADSGTRREEPFYISHYGRHGSRYLINADEYKRPYEILKAANDAGKLSVLGKDVFRRVKMLCNESDHRLGELTPLGAQQHKQIAQRMFERFPEVFEGDVTIDAKSTLVIRCILSMENALQQLQLMNPV